MSLTRVRNPYLFSLAVVLLAGASGLGLVLRHDGEAVPDLESLDSDGDVRLKGDLVPFSPPTGDRWSPVRALLSNSTFLLRGDVDGTVLVTGVGGDAGGEDRVVYGDVAFAGIHPDTGAPLVVVRAEQVYEPYFAW